MIVKGKITNSLNTPVRKRPFEVGYRKLYEMPDGVFEKLVIRCVLNGWPQAGDYI